ncbi:MAG: TorF family putative porin [Gemmatimonas sp.]
MNRLLTAAVMGALALALGSAAYPAGAAEDKEKEGFLRSETLGGSFTGTIAVTSEYFARGKTNTRPGVPGIQPQIEFDHDSGAYFQVFGSNVDKPAPEDSGRIELDYFAGFRNDIGDLGYDLMAGYTTYPGAHRADGLDFNFFELTAKVDYDLDWAKPYVAVSWSPEYQYESGEEWYYVTGVEVPIGKNFTAMAHVGHSTFDRNRRAGNNDYSDWALGLGTSVLGLDLKLEYVATDLPRRQCISGCDRVVFTVSKTF